MGRSATVAVYDTEWLHETKFDCVQRFMWAKVYDGHCV